MSTNNDTILVVGGGLGGLAAALGLGRKGRRVHVIEQAREIAPIGYGIQMGPNVFPMFDRLGVTETVLRASHLPPSIMMADALSGEVLIEAPVTSARYKERFTHPYIVIHRADIHNILLDACKTLPNIELTVSATVTGFSQNADGVRVTCEDGRVFDGAALIGSDGIKSHIREPFVTNDAMRPNGYVAHRAVIDMKDVPPGTPHLDKVVLWGGPGCHVVTYPLRHDSIFNIVVVFRPPPAAAEEEVPDFRAEIMAVYKHVTPELKALIELVDAERRWVLADRDPIRHWTEGRVTLLGDAAHPTFQTLAQGACMAIEDADRLVRELEATDYDYPTAFAAYTAARVLRTARVQLTSRWFWEFYHREGIGRDVRNAEAREYTHESFYDCVNWVWGGPDQA